MSVLVLEDELLLALEMEELLTSLGYVVIGPFTRISDALVAIPDCNLFGAVLDLNLQGEMSFPVIQALQEKGVPVIVCSAYIGRPELKPRLEGIPVIAKPWDTQKLDRLIAKTFHPQIEC